ncbi:unnamed protein product [Urochloa decumbens]|uniref:Uncharacterized protein n=1 Tax=Urochloa decumbens TaxID=240449 RepID=A0ABC8YWG0_9POAL
MAAGREGEATGGAPKLPQAAAFGHGLLGLGAASTAITLAVIEPPPCLDKNGYFLVLSGLFFAGMTQVAASVGTAAAGRRHVAGTTKLVVCASLVVAAGLTAASLLL